MAPRRLLTAGAAAACLLGAAAACLLGAASGHAHYDKVAKWQRIRREGPCQPAYEICVDKFVQELPIPPVAVPTRQTDKADEYVITMMPGKHSFHPDVPATTLFTYEGTFPGPTIMAEVGKAVLAEFPNALPTEHILPVDETVCEEPPAGRAVVHLHGGHQSWKYDGNAYAWYTPGYAKTGPDWRDKAYSYHNKRPSGTLFYHDHAACVTRLNVQAGLVGLYILQDPAVEARLRLPAGEFDVPLVLMDRGLYPNGSLAYPPDGIVPEFFGNVSVVNGAAWPVMTVAPAAYRLRLVAAANARWFSLQLFVVDPATGQPILDQPGPDFTVVASEGGYLDAPVPLEGQRLVMGPAERYDVVVDFAGWEGTTLLLHNDAGTPYAGPGDASGNVVPLPDIMQFTVAAAAPEGEGSGGRQPFVMPVALVPLPPVPAVKADTPVFPIPMNEYTDDQGRLVLLLEKARCSDPITTKVVNGTTAVFEFINTTPDFHPMHVHLVSFRILGFTPFDVATYDASDKLVYTGPMEAPKPYEAGMKDTVGVPPGYTVQVIAEYDRIGPYMFHCHILEHEDYDMMRFYSVEPTLEQLAADTTGAVREDWKEAQEQMVRLGRPGGHQHKHGKLHKVKHH